VSPLGGPDKDERDADWRATEADMVKVERWVGERRRSMMKYSPKIES